MRITGITPCTLLDFPETPSCILFFAGCNLRCGFCHNPEMILPEQIQHAPSLPWSAVIAFLKKRRGLLEGVVLCGGEPTLVPELESICTEIASLGFKIKLDTNGTQPRVLESLMDKHLIDYVALDVKGIDEQLGTMCKGERYIHDIKTSLSILKKSEIPFEVRTTVIRELHSQEMLLQMGKDIGTVPRWYLQAFRPMVTLDEHYQTYHPYTKFEMETFCKKLRDVTQSSVICR